MGMTCRIPIVVAAGALLIVACAGPTERDGGPVASASRAPSTAGATPVAPSSVGDPILVRSALPDGTSVGGIAWNGTTFLIAGASDRFDRRSRPTAWTSSDGAAWTEAGGADCEGSFTSVLVHDGRFVAAGACEPMGAIPSVLVATSGDGGTWDISVVEGPGLGNQGDGWVSDAIATGPGGLMLLAGENGRTHAWRSTDGRAWRRVSDVESSGGANLYGGRPGYLVVGGTGDGKVGAWLSSDGATWTVSEIPAGWPVSIVGAEDGFLGLTDLRGAWRSADGLTWRKLALRPDGISRLVAGAGGILGIGTDDGLHAWWTATGESWLPVADTPVDDRPLHAAGAVSAGGRLVVVAERETPNPDPDVMQVLPAEIQVWIVPLGG